ncbi:SPL family radical SAM protein [Sulfolobus acidocaldarius]|uniref:Conserved Archaeal protein n=4 Tax=Sulfolobus acidocaldarius TaxID=2285 RepID=Q4J9N6_SULAC|nr:radical SAM protein [Sulfolobus acidocaldarius]AAY80493.1 conserved Archaeal protein [Sulfolobus acidocaldarius DSM 639]AGE71078.1 hypothetical protein SacN8_05555 [Sulfolobus acidocaldarius N8]AGE73349.1 hypothetical protein SacRon12I_05545 [Sulfolobus acidocaldarius Ron12/I]ALU28642.1 radical SAM protein [Sulfolobus acidocaldarius]ALU31358.1 radical SAM protein [Sulfolobus acidocaldarius]
MIIREVEVKSALSKSGLKEIDYSLNPYNNCRFSCIYCYAQRYVSDKWGEVITIKRNIVDVLKREVYKYRRGVVGVSTIVDPYQPVEGLYKLTRKSLEVLLSHGFRVSIQTKSPMVVRDLDLLSRYSDKVDVGLTITTLDKVVSRYIEPLAPPPKARAESIKKLSRSVRTWIFLGPIIKGVNDSGFEEIVKLASETSSFIVYDKYNNYRGLPNFDCNQSWWEEKENEIKDLCERYGVHCHSEREDWIYERQRRYKTLF